MDFGSLLQKDSEYAYIGTFLYYLYAIIEIIKNLFSGISLKKNDEKKDDAKA